MIDKNSFLGALIKTGGGSLLTLFFSIIAVKIVSINLGPSGVGILSLGKQLMLSLALIGYGCQTAVIQGISKRQGTLKAEFAHSAFFIYFIGSILTIFISIFFTENILNIIGKQGGPEILPLIKWIWIPVTILIFSIYFKTLLNGYGFIGSLAIVEVLGPLFLCIFIYPICQLIISNSIFGYILILLIPQFFSFIAGIFYSLKFKIFNLFSFVNVDFSKEYTFEIIQFSLVTMVISLISTVGLLVVKFQITNTGGIYAAGLFESAWTISSSYVMLVLGALGTYFLPLVSGEPDLIHRKRKILKVFRATTILMTPLIICIILIKYFIINILYTKEFTPAVNIINWMLIGDYLKITSWLFGIVILATRKLKVYLYVEMLWNILFIAISIFGIKIFNDINIVGVAYVISYFFSMVFYGYYICKKFDISLHKNQVMPWSFGLILVVACSIQNYFFSINIIYNLIIWLPIALTYVFTMLRRREVYQMKKFLRVFK